MPNKKFTISVVISSLALIAVNLYSLYGVFYLGWNSYQIIMLYWFESIPIFIFSYLKMRKTELFGGVPIKGQIGKKDILSLSLFTVGDTIFLLILFGFKNQFGNMPVLFYANLWAIIGFFVSHGISYWANYIGREEYKKADVAMISNNAALRIFPIHFVAMLGILISAPAKILVGIKIPFDILSHLAERIKYTKFAKNLNKKAFDWSEGFVTKTLEKAEKRENNKTSGN